MSTKSKLKKIQKYQCQICGDWQGKDYPAGTTFVEAHHIKHKSEEGKDTMDNLITLCDLCHAVFHSQKCKEYFGPSVSEEELQSIRQEFEEYIKLPLEKREEIRRKVWAVFGIETRN